MADVGKISVPFDVRLSELEQKLSKAEQRLKRTGKAADGAGGAFSDKFLKGAAKVVASAGTLELAFGSISTIARGLRGDMEGMLTAAEQLPAGIGPAIRQFRAMTRELTGAAEATERLEKARTGTKTIQNVGRTLRRLRAEASGDTKRIALIRKQTEAAAFVEQTRPGIDEARERLAGLRERRASLEGVGKAGAERRRKNLDEQIRIASQSLQTQIGFQSEGLRLIGSSAIKQGSGGGVSITNADEIADAISRRVNFGAGR